MLIMLIMLIMLLLFSCMLTITPRITGEIQSPEYLLPFLGIYESITAHVHPIPGNLRGDLGLSDLPEASTKILVHIREIFYRHTH